MKVRRVAALVLSSILTVGMLTTVMQPASACTSGTRCYGRVRWAQAPSNSGAEAQIRVSCLDVNSSDSHMADDELWVANANASNWVEEGMALGDPWDESVPTNIRYWFWADNRPFYGYFEHDFTGLSVNLNRDYDALIQYRGEGAWDVFRDGSPIGLSIPNFLAPAEWLAAGSESTVTTPHVDAYVKFLRWRDTGGGWHGDWVNGANNASLQEQDTYAIDWLTTYQGAHVTSSTGGCP